MEDRERGRKAGIPETLRFQTKCELAQQMLERVRKAQLPIRWVVADSVYGSKLDLRNWLEAYRSPYVLAVACDEPVGSQLPDGAIRPVTVAEVEALLLHDEDWHRLSMSAGTKGPHFFDWACVAILHQWEHDGQQWLYCFTREKI